MRKVELLEEESELKKMSRSNKRKVSKVGKRIVFCLISFIFMMGCCIFYGTRLVKYYKQFHPKATKQNSTVLLANSIISKSSIVYEGSGLYIYNGNYIYKGKDANNYLMYNNMLWRIVKISSDKTMEIVLDNYINILNYDNTSSNYIKSDLNKYLNDKFLQQLDKSYLDKSSICTDTITNLSKITCNKFNVDNYVKLLDVSTYLNSKADNNTYINETSNVWLTNNNGKAVWTINNGNLSTIKPNNSYLVKPVITLKSTNTLVSGKGTKDNPYIIEKQNNKLGIGNYLDLDGDIWIIYDKNKSSYYLQLEDLKLNTLKLHRFDTLDNEYNIKSSTSLGYYLNNTFYNSLSYKALLQETSWYTGSYQTTYKDIYSKSIKAYVGIPNMNDLKYGKNIQNYYLSTPSKASYVYMYSSDLLESKITLARVPRPTISIGKLNIKSGQGTENSPYIMEVK